MWRATGVGLESCQWRSWSDIYVALKYLYNFCWFQENTQCYTAWVPGLVESRLIVQTRLSTRLFGKMSDLPVEIPRDQRFSIWQDLARQRTTVTGVRQLHIFIIPSKHLELVCIADSCSQFAIWVDINKFLSCSGLSLLLIFVCMFQWADQFGSQNVIWQTSYSSLNHESKTWGSSILESNAFFTKTRHYLCMIASYSLSSCLIFKNPS